ncbi:hypothetical protein N0V82_002541 [Gnomoniopsis sp. IMI 355080]|nr:hypothetical protein N0V82_002541 [Gnomoniopsis sp. IMI 355080]
MASTSNSGAQCVFCDAISRLSKTPRRRNFYESIEITSETDDPISWNCTIHESLLHAANPRDGDIDIGIDRGQLMLDHMKKSSFFSVLAPGRGGPDRLELVRRDDVPGHYGKGRIIDSEWIDLATIRGFVDNCKARHGDLCDKFPFGNSCDFATLPRPAYLIDVQDACLVDASIQSLQSAEYLTLACTPGHNHDNYLATRKDNLASLQTPGRLTANDLSPSLARTTKDAMELTALLGYRYLWVDHLCIVRDDAVLRHAEITKTAFIYAGAVFCIAECNGKDPNYGIRGIRELADPQPRSFHQNVYRVRDGEAFVRPASVMETRSDYLADLYRASGKLPKDTFAWQAGPKIQTVLARRTLRFDRGTVSFACKSYAWWEKDIPKDANAHMWEDNAHSCDAVRFGCQMDKPRRVDDVGDEDVDYDDEGSSSPRDPHWSFALAARWPAVHEYYKALWEITHLVAPLNTDILDLTAGLTAGFSLRFEGRFINGLPESCFDTALLWDLDFGRGSTLNPKAPSWSWAGWTGIVSPEKIFEGLDYVVSKVSMAIETIPKVAWSVGDSPSLAASQREPIHCRKWFEAREAFQDTTQDVPPGWTRLHRRVHYSSGCPKGYDPEVQYQHELAPDKSFWYPIPMVTSEPDLTAAVTCRQIRPRYLFGATERCTVYISRSDKHGRTTDKTVLRLIGEIQRRGCGGQPNHVLRDGAGVIVGVLTSHADVADALYGTGAPERTAVEILTISRGRTPRANTSIRAVHLAAAAGVGNDTGWFEFYNVLWVEWRVVDGVKVAERKGLGRVGTEAWERLDRTNIDVVLF